jgi:sugar/nucleoside kinase (ribokinase family)
VKSPIPCFPSHPRDTTGAGDAFNGALAARLPAASRCMAARFAAAYAAVSVEKRAHHLYRITRRHENGFYVPPLIMKWLKPYCIKPLRG